MNTELMKALDHLWSVEDKTNIRGVDYDNVATRIAAFRRNFDMAQWRLTSEIIRMDDEAIVIRGVVERLRGETWEVVGDGLAEERRSKQGVNATSAVENCQTSAWGRALACIGLGGKEVASAEEMKAVLRNDHNDEPSEEYLTLAKCETYEDFCEVWKGLSEKGRKKVSLEELSELKAKFKEGE